jgi:hypothetical protein
VPKARSPVLGYNHNIRHNGWMFHVQTEDSGMHSPHVYTHLFHGGVIIASKKLEYDAEADSDVVKGLMQAQHKSVMKELKHGAYDAKIKAYLGDAPPSTPGPGIVDEQEGATLEAVPLDVAMADAGATLPTPMDEVVAVAEAPAVDIPELITADESSAGTSSPYAQILVADMSTPAAVSGTLSIGSRGAPPAGAGPPPRAVELDDDDDINGLLDRLRADAPAPELLEDSPTDAQYAVAESPGAWVVARPGQKERPFEKSSPVPVPLPGTEEVGRRQLTPPSIDLESLHSPGSSYSQHRRPSVSTSPVSAATPPLGSRPDGTPRRPTSPSRPAPPRPPASGTGPQGKPGGASRSHPAVRAPGSSPPRAPAPPVLPRGASTSSTPVLPRSTPSAGHPSVAARPPAAARSQAQTTVLPRGHVPPAPAGKSSPPAVRPAMNLTPRRGSSGESVVVARPAVVIGAPTAQITGEASGRRTVHGREATPPPHGHELISEKSLDEVIMAYLSEDASEE